MLLLCFAGLCECAPTAPQACETLLYDPVTDPVASAADCDLGLCPFECVDGGGICSAEAGIYCETCSRLFTYADGHIQSCPECEITEGTGGAILMTCP